MSDFNEVLPGEMRQRYAWFHNALRVLLNIDGDQFPGIDRDWPEFRDNPWRYFIRADDIVSAKLYALIEGRKAFPEPIDAIRAERTRIAAHVDCAADCRYVNASGTCQRTDEICSHHVAEAIRAGEAP